MMLRTPPAIEGNRLNRHKTARQLSERERSGYKKGLLGVETDRDATKRSRRSRKNKEIRDRGAGSSTSVASPPYEKTHERHASQGGCRASHAGRPETRAVQEAAPTTKRASGVGGKNIVKAEPTHTPLSENTISMPAGTNTAFYAHRHRGCAALEAESTANGAASVYTEDVNKTASHRAPPVECAARNDSVKMTSPPVHTP